MSIDLGQVENMRRIKLIVAYDGTAYCGWQLQNNGVTIEAVLNHALQSLFNEDIKVIGASRTDAGVHAFGNVAVFDTQARMPADKMAYALNQRLPEDVVIQSSEEVKGDWHPRKCNSKKTYVYRILNRRFPLPSYRDNAYFYYGPLDADRIREACSYLLGEHDFKSFCSIKTHMEDTVRRIYQLDIDQDGECLLIKITGDGFLYNMVRIIAGTLIRIGSGKMEPKDMMTILKAKNRELAGPTAPAKGLTLVSIDYDDASEDIIEIRNEEWHYQWIQKEIPSKGKAYLIIKACCDDVLAALVARMALKSFRNGAKSLFISDQEADRLAAIQVQAFQVRPAYEMWRMERALDSRDIPAGNMPGTSLEWVPVEEEHWEAFCSLLNNSFFDIPASATYTGAELEAARMDDRRQQHLILHEGERIAAVEFYDWDEELELSILAVAAGKRGLGWGSLILKALIEMAVKSGKDKIALTVSNQNKIAVHLYEQNGFQFKAQKSCWFLIKDGKTG